MSLLRTKSIEQSIADTDEPEYQLRKSLSALDLTVFGVGVVIGAVVNRAAASIRVMTCMGASKRGLSLLACCGRGDRGRAPAPVNSRHAAIICQVFG